MSLIESATLHLEPLVVAHADEMFGPMSEAAIYAYVSGGPPVSVVALRQRYQQLERGHSANGSVQAGDFGVRAVFATVDPRNSRSIRLLERLGFGEVPAKAYPRGDVEPGDRVFSLPLAPEGDASSVH
jgi:hypothetical protein